MISIRSEILRVFLSAVTIAVTAAIFPYASIGFRAAAPEPVARPQFAFVALSADEEEAALRAAKSTWQTEPSADGRAQTRLALGELPEDPVEPVLEIGIQPPAGGDLTPIAYPIPPWRPSVGAAATEKMKPAQPEQRPAAFPREDLLKID